MNDKKILLLICNCGCKAQLQIQKIDDLYLIDTREDGRRKWMGVSLEGKNIVKLKDFLSS